MILSEQTIDDLEIVVIIKDMQIAQGIFKRDTFPGRICDHQIKN